MIICKQCGAEFDENKPACPYCGELNYPGAEAMYMEHMEDIREDLSQMKDDSKEAYVDSAKKHATIIIATLSILLLLAAILLMIFLICSNLSSKADEDLLKAQMLWQQEYFDEMNAMYESGQYDELLLFLDEHSEDEGYSFYYWEHSDFIEAYDTYKIFQTEYENLDVSNKTSLKWLLYYAVFLDYMTAQDYYLFSEKEYALLESYTKETHAFYKDVLGLDDDGIDEMKAYVSSDNQWGLPASDLCKDYLEAYYYNQ